MVHGHYRNSRVSRLVHAKHHREHQASIANDSKANLLGAVDTRTDLSHSPDSLSGDTCDPLRNITCPDDAPDTEVPLSKRQAAESPPSPPSTSPQTTQTVVQVVNTNSQTLWQSVGVDYPMTISDPVLGVVTISDSLGLSASVALLIPSPTPPKVSPSPALATKQTAAVSSPRQSSAVVSQTSTPLTQSSNKTNSLSTSSSVVSTTTSSSTSTSTSSSSSISSSSSTGTSSIYGETGTSTGYGSPPTTSASKPSSGAAPPAGAATPKIVGGVVGSVAGLAMIVLLIIFLLRRRNFFQRKGTEALPSNDNDAGTGARQMAERPTSHDPLFSAQFAPAFVKRWRQSNMTATTESTMDSSNTSERGFQKISGRKIPPVLTHGGDGFGGGMGGDSPTLPDYLTGIYPTSPRGGPPSSPSLGPPPRSPYGARLDTKYTRENEEHIGSPTRPSPARMPMSNSVNSGTPTTVNPSYPVAQPQSVVRILPSRPDGLGRSFPSYDGSRGSRGSRFTESLEL